MTVWVFRLPENDFNQTYGLAVGCVANPTLLRPQKQLIRRIVGLVVKSVAYVLQKIVECLIVGVWYINANQNPAVIRTVIAIMKQRNIPLRFHRTQKAG